MHMSFESPQENSTETPEANYDRYYQESLAIAQELSRKWKTLRDKKKKDPRFLAGNPLLEEIDAASRPPVSGIQSWFESQVRFVNTQSDPEARSRMMYRVKEDIERIEQKVDDLIGSEDPAKTENEKSHRKDILRRNDVDITQNKDFDESLDRLLEENGFRPGDKVIFFAERERDGVLEKDRDGTLTIRDTKGNPWGILGLMMDRAGYIRRP